MAGASTGLEAFASRRVTLDGVEIHLRDSAPEAEDGPAVLLLHGFPQHSLMWHAVAPRLASACRVVALDSRGMGGSSVPLGGYDKTTMAGDVLGVMDALDLTKAHVVGYDLGAGVACALARDHPDRVDRLAVMEFGLAGFGYEQMMTPQPDWSLRSNWHLALMCVPDAAEWLLRGRERELLDWFFWHNGYGDGLAVSAAHFDAYHRAITRPGVLRAGIETYAAVWADAQDNAALKDTPLTHPALALGGEASSGPALEQIWGGVMSNLTTHVIPRAGHWPADENPDFVAEALVDHFGLASGAAAR